MDLLYSKYANPFIFLDNLILVGRFEEIVEKITFLHIKERDDKILWEYYIHRVFDMSFKDFKEKFNRLSENHQPTEVELETTIKDSRKMLDGFNPY